MQIYTIRLKCLLLCLVGWGGILVAQTAVTPNQVVMGEVVITNASNINTQFLEFSPTYYQNGIVYTTAKRQSGPRDANIDATFFELSYAELDGNGIPTGAEPFSVEMNSQVHEGPVTFSRDGNTIFFTRNNLVNGTTRADKNGKVRMKVFQATKGYFDWENVRELPFNNDEYDVMHPSLSPDGKWLFFTSNMPGSIGGTDIWVVSKDGDTFGTPVNLGPQVNTSKNEAFPFIHESGTLFYASKGLAGKGGYDIFKTQNDGGKWQEPVNIGMPFNTNADDFGLIMNASGTQGAFTSARADGSGKDDIYMFEVGEGYLSAPTPDLKAMIRVYDQKTSERIEGAAIRIFERTADGIIAGGDLYDVVLLPSGENANELVMKLIPKDAATLGEPHLQTNASGESPYSMRPDRQYILFVSKEGYATNELVYSTVAKSETVVVEVPLKRKTCATLKGYVIDANTGGVLPGATVRVSNDCDSAQDMIVSDASGVFSYCVPFGCEFTFAGSKAGYSDGIGSVMAKDVADMTTTIRLTPITLVPPTTTTTNDIFVTGTSIVLDKIYYDFNKSSIRKGAAIELDALASIMLRHPSMEIELISHTDCRGTAAYNLRLSQRRAESAKQYLVRKGVEARRIVAFGKGETTPRNGCVDGVPCNESEHQYNRRTEVRVTKVDEAVQIQYGDKGPEVIDYRRQ